jgi:serine/threonine protein kinase
MTDYQEAVQVPSAAFSGPELQRGVPVMNKLGLPRPICGQFASVYELEHAGNRWAVKCFLRNIPDLHSRYARISQHLSACSLPYFVTFEYQQKGIRVRGNPYPLVKMEWVEGLGLNHFIERNLSNANVMAALEQDWLKLLEDLQAVNVAHGDLQHGNVLVTADGSLRLIDYDGMWVPKLKGQKSNEVGHPDYQSPLRTERDFHADIDGFAGDVIHVAIRALAAQPQLWAKYNNGDNLLFRRQDFVNPGSSPLFAEVRALGDDEIAEKVDDLIRACGAKPKRGRPSRFFKPKKAKAAREAATPADARQAPQASAPPAPPPPPPPAPPAPAKPQTPKPLVGGLAPSPRRVIKPPKPAPPPRPAPAPKPAAPAPRGTGSWLDDHTGAVPAARGATVVKAKRKPSPGARQVRKTISDPRPPWRKRLLGFARLLIHFLLIGPVTVASVMEVQELRAGSGDRAAAILACGFGLALLLGLLSLLTLYVGRRAHRTLGTVFFALTAVIMLLNIFSELLTAGWSEWTGDDPIQCAVMLAMLVLSGLGLAVEYSCHRLGVVTRWRPPWNW